MKIKHWKIPVLFTGIPSGAFYFDCEECTKEQSRKIAEKVFAEHFGYGWSLGKTTIQEKEV